MVAGRLRGFRGCAAALVLLGLAVSGLVGTPQAAAVDVPAGFQEETVFSGLTQPTAVRFAGDGRVFVAEKSGLVKVFDNLTDTTPTVFADLRTQVHNFWDRGLLGLALHPDFPANPWVYVLYTHDAVIGGTAPRWGSVGGTSDGCPTPPGATADGCVVSGRLSRLQASGNVMVGAEDILIEDWCQQYPSHSIGSLVFSPDGDALYVSGGDGASFNFVDFGQDGTPVNPCGDPPSGVGGSMSPPTAEGGALRSQDLRTTGDPASLDGAILRVDPATGEGLPGNPLFSSSDANARRIVGYGLRNPFRMTLRPGTNEVWAGDVGWNDWEEINRLTNPTDNTVDNFGWPCYEGDGRQNGYDSANLNLCENLYTAGSGAVVPPYFRYHHNDLVVPNDVCPKGGSSVAGVSFAFYEGGNYPPEYRGALFFADYTRRCIWSIEADPNGLPDVSKRRTFVAGAAQPVDVQIGPGGDLFYVDLGGTIRRIRYFSTNQPPIAVITAQPTSGPAPLTVAFDGTASSDPDNDPLTYAWDLDDDGAFDDSNSPTPSYTYTQASTYTPSLQVTDNSGATGVASVTITAGNTPPRPVIDTPSASTTWRVGDTISFSGHAVDDQDGSLPGTALSWRLILQHCPSTCHEHELQTVTGTGGSFVAPDHEYPSHLELRLTATDSGGLSDTVSTLLNPQTVQLEFATQPSGLTLTVGSTSQATPFSRTVITGSTASISANSPQALNGQTYEFVSWSDDGAQTHTVVANSSTTYTATFALDATVPVVSNVVARPGPGRVTISWSTNEPSDSQVEYGRTTGYGSFAPPLQPDRTLTTQHSITITGLDRKTTYFYRVLSRDAAGNLGSSLGSSFRTK
ncbi:MAG TPA: PQQ-dependent sugar dehydrogenase [Jiangellaceae bacterium]|nr:PQQ-dependent sugar dehydrogenase [Jiangellaceae bacterium]